MPRLSDATRQRRREAIADAAMRRFARDGFANTSMADIIEEAGSSAGSVYSNFANKADLVRFAASNALRDMVAAVGDELPAERTPASVLAHLLQSSGDRARAQTLLQIWAEMPRDGELAEIGCTSIVELRTLIRDAVLPWCREHRTRAGAAADALTDGILTAVQGFLVRIAIDVEADPATVAAHAVAVFDAL